MKKGIIIIMAAVCFGTAGCSSLGDLVALEQSAYSHAANDPLHPIPLQMRPNEAKSFRVYNSNPYALHVGIEKAASDPNRTPVNGDGGASLNAYAACLKLKVMF